MPDREYPTGALDPPAAALRVATEVVKASREYAVSIPGEKYLFEAPEDQAYDIVKALAAMSPEDRAALARWLWPEGRDEKVRIALAARAATLAATGGRPLAFPTNPPRLVDCEAALTLAEQHVATVTAERDAAEAATVKRITEWLRDAGPKLRDERDCEAIIGAADAIEREFGGGPDE